MTREELLDIITLYFGDKRGCLLKAAIAFDITYVHLFKMLKGKVVIPETRAAAIRETIKTLDKYDFNR